MDNDTALQLGMRAYARAAAPDLAANGVSWDIIPKRRWDASQTPRGWIVSGYRTVMDIRDDAPMTVWLVRSRRRVEEVRVPVERAA